MAQRDLTKCIHSTDVNTDLDKYPWWLLRLNRAHLEPHKEKLEGYDLTMANGSKGKGWHESKLFFGKS